MTSYKHRIATVAPPTLEKQLEVLTAARSLATQGDEFWRQRRAEIAAVRRKVGELVVLRLELQRQYGEFIELVQEERRRRDPRLRSHVIRDDSDRPTALKASPDDPKHPGWPAGTPEGRGGKFRPKDGDEGVPAALIPVQYGPNPNFPPPPPGYDPKTWTQGRWWNNNKYYLRDPDGNIYTVHPEDDRHWRHWDKQDRDGNDQGGWPPNFRKPWPGQKRLKDDQSWSDPNADEPPWTPNPFTPIIPVPMPLPPIPAPEPITPEIPLFVPG